VNVKQYFDDEQDEEESSNEAVIRIKPRTMNKDDYSGKRFNEWSIVSVVDQKANIYKVVCSCGKEFIRDVYLIINLQNKQCRFCYKKKAYFNLL